MRFTKVFALSCLFLAVFWVWLAADSREVVMAEGAAVASNGWDRRFGRPLDDFSIYVIRVYGEDVYIGGGGEFDYHDDPSVPPVDSLLHWDGEQWQTLGLGFNDVGSVNDIVRFDGDLYVGGYFETIGGIAADSLARWDGERWWPVAEFEGRPRQVNVLEVIDGQLYIGGEFEEVDNVTVNNIARWDGETWFALDGGVSEDGYGSVSEIQDLLPHEGMLYVGGDFTQGGEINSDYVIAWDLETEAWVSLDGGVTLDDDLYFGEVQALEIFQGDLVIAGKFDEANGRSVSNIARWDGVQWHPLEGGTSDTVLALLTVDDVLYVGGRFEQVDNQIDTSLAMWDGATWSAVDEQDYDDISVLTANNKGGFYAGHLSADMFRVAEWTGTRWLSLGKGIDHGARALAADDEGNIYLGGSDQHLAQAGNIPINGVGMWNGVYWSAVGPGEDDSGFGVDGTVLTILADGDEIYFGGQFTAIGGISAANIAKWNRSTGVWSALGSGMNAAVLDLTLDDTGVLYAAGAFTAAGGLNANRVAWWDGADWQNLGAQAPLFEGPVFALAFDGNDLYLGGQFPRAQGSGPIEDYNHIAHWNRMTHQLMKLGEGVAAPVSGFEAAVFDLVVIGDALYVGGHFSQAGLISANDMVRWETQTGTWEAMDSGVGGSNSDDDYNAVRALVADGTNLYVGGQFARAGTETSPNVALWDTAGETWVGLDGGLATLPDGDIVSYLDEYDDGVFALTLHGGDLYMGGGFYAAGLHPAQNFGRWGVVPPQSTSNVVTAAGGMLDSGEGVTLTFPPNAVSEETTVQYQGLLTPSSALPSDVVGVRSFQVTATDSGGTVSLFAEPYTLEIAYTAADLTAVAVDETMLNVAYWNGSAWVELLPCAGCGVDVGQDRVTVMVDFTAEFVLIGRSQRVFLPLAVKGD